MLNFHPLVAVLLLCYWQPYLGGILIVIIIIFYFWLCLFGQGESLDKDKQDGKGKEGRRDE